MTTPGFRWTMPGTTLGGIAMRRSALMLAAVLLFASEVHAQATTAAMCDTARQQAADERDAANQAYTAAAGVVSSANFYLAGSEVWIRYNTSTATTGTPWQSADAAYGRGEYALAYQFYVESFSKAQVARRLAQAALSSP